VDRLATVSVFGAIALTIAATAVAAEEATTDVADAAAANNTPDSRPGAVVDTASRRVYKVDDVGMIIGGASEDAKAKVRRLPVRK